MESISLKNEYYFEILGTFSIYMGYFSGGNIQFKNENCKITFISNVFRD